APTVASLALAALQERAVAQPAVMRASRARDLPLSFAQERLWFLDQLVPGDAFYNIPAALRVRGALDVGALGRSVSEVVRRHEALRTTFRSRDGRPCQVIGAPAPVDLEVVDISELEAGEREEMLQRRVREEALRAF